MNIAEALNEQLRLSTYRYRFVSIIESSKRFTPRDEIEHCSNFKLRCISEIHNDYYDIVNIQFCGIEITDVNMDKATDAFNKAVIIAMAWSIETKGNMRSNRDGTPIYTFRDILKLISEDKPLSK